MSKNGTIVPWLETPAGQQVQARLAEERTLQAIDRLLTRLDTVEQAVSNLATMMHQGPGLTAMVVDMADEAYRTADRNGVSIDERLKNALALAEKLTTPTMLEKLNGLLTLADQAPGLVAMAGDMVDEAYRNADARGVSIDQRLSTALALAEKLTAPEMVGKLDGLLSLSDQLPGLVAMGIDILDEGMRSAIASGIDPQALAQWAGQAGQALSQAQAEPPAKVGGIFGLLRAIKDPDRQKALGFLMNFLKHLGSKM
ncbi:MAG: DUF1641 domain-containing protein [Bacteroidetes bacterium]|nr:MAG: DUF1641 domain-containing protein [Bacteroidota bacterium]